MLLIAPNGIETSNEKLEALAFSILLIAPNGIETWAKISRLEAFILLIAPNGIETERDVASFIVRGHF